MKRYLLVLMMLLSGVVYAQDLIYTGFFSNKALNGYDTVAYFTDNKPIKGDEKYVTEYKGANWYFSSAEHLSMFKENPEKYAPQYGGYCAWAVAAKSDFASGDPNQWSLIDGKLYLNYNADVKADWDKDPQGFIKKGDQNWPKLINK
ncbi:YHS domain protein [Marinomonas piezotolerans]|uniref:YHS domain protein n=1 Tax=Marinomonas piezotolerans TaxID=2213058 RepID=A0A370UCX1_9GAMM|nr:YHS domain-containing (seleno)protein [Marinomonas piezotolerans]RDL45628.1 YHS domain protein [Marinomonas piezotolerans]